MKLEAGIKEISCSTLKIKEPMANHTSLKIGGPADYFIVPGEEEELKELLHFCRNEFIPFFVFSGGTNILVSDKGIRGLAVKIGEAFKFSDISGSRITAGAGMPLPVLAARAAREGLSGLEFAAGIPGAVGGAVLINAGAYGNCMADLIRRVKVLTWQGEIKIINYDELNFGYRHSSLIRENWIVLEAEMKLVRGEYISIKQKMEKLLSQRRKNHPVQPSAGSVFRNPLEESAGRLIERSGCKGLRVGDAQVSHKHANFIINLGRARATDYLEVITRVRERVFEEFGVMLEPEINMVGEES